MLKDITEEQKRVFYSVGYTNHYQIIFDDISLIINNDIIHSEEVSIKETICDEEDFVLGGCIASSIEYTVSEIVANQISGLEFTVKLHVSDETGNNVLSIPMGVYRVDSAKRVNDQDYKQVTAYDRLYDASVDVSGWYNGLFPVIDTEDVVSKDEEGNQTIVTKNVYGTTTVKEMRESLLMYLGIPFVSQTLPNDHMVVSKTIEPAEGSLPGTTVLKALCTVNGGFGRMNREGAFEVVFLKGFGVFPEDSREPEGNIYPEETLYPEDSFQYLGVSDGEDSYPEYRSVTYEEYMTQPITCLNIQTDQEDVGLTIGTDAGNPYVITANFLLYGKSGKELEEVGQNIFNRIEGITYRPNTTELNGLPYLECGDVFALVKRTDTLESYIFNRTLTGIQALIDTFEARGNKVRANEVSASEEIQQLKGKILKIVKSVDEVSAEIIDLENNTNAKLELTAEHIQGTVAKAQVIWDLEYDTQVDFYGFEEPKSPFSSPPPYEGFENGSTYFDQTNGKLYKLQLLNVSPFYRWTMQKQYKLVTENLSSRILETAESIEMEVSRATSAENSLSSRLTVTSNEVAAEVSRATNAEGSLSSRISVTANEISSKVSKGDVVSEINQSSDRIYLSAGQLIISSGNLTLDSTGNAAFSGTLSGASGTFSGDLSGTEVNFYGLRSFNGSISFDGVNGDIKGTHVIASSSKGVQTNSISSWNGSYVDVNSILRINSHGLVAGGDVIPSSNGGANLGQSSYRWSEVYASKSAINTSDRRQKRNIKPIGEEYEKLWFSLKPVSFLFNDGDRIHWGMISQDLEQSMKELGLSDMDVAMFCKDEKKVFDEDSGKMLPVREKDGKPEYVYSLRYGELIALNTHMLQKAYRKIEKQEQKIKALEEKLQEDR